MTTPPKLTALQVADRKQVADGWKVADSFTGTDSFTGKPRGLTLV
jgi:hypothetical protein